MNRTCFLLFAFSFLVSCEAKQWNLNKSLRWESDHQFKLLYVKWIVHDTTGYAILKKEMDTKIASKLVAAHLGQPVESDDSGKTDLLFLVPKEYERALEMIIKETRLSGKIKKFMVVEREYVSETEWVDKEIHSE